MVSILLLGTQRFLNGVFKYFLKKRENRVALVVFDIF